MSLTFPPYPPPPWFLHRSNISSICRSLSGLFDLAGCCCCLVASVLFNPVWPYELQPAWLLCPWDSLGKVLEWAAIPSSRASSWPRDWTWVSFIAGIVFTTESWPQVLSMLLHMAGFPSLIWLNNISLCIYISHLLYPLTQWSILKIVSLPWLLWIMLQWT